MFYTSHYECNHFNVDINYPFNFKELSIQWSECHPFNRTIDFDLLDNAETYAQQFVVTWWISFFYSLLFICIVLFSALKVRIKKLYEIFTLKMVIMFGDMIFSIIILIFLFVCEHIWGNYFTSLKNSLKFGNLIKIIMICKSLSTDCIIKSNEKLKLLDFLLIWGFFNIFLSLGDIVLILDNFYIVLEDKWKTCENKVKPSISSNRRTAWKSSGVFKLVVNVNRTIGALERPTNQI